MAPTIGVAERSGRSDLSGSLRHQGDELARTSVTIAVVGEFKQGKSTLVNALVNAEICPADPVHASIAPITVSYGEASTLTTEYADGRSETVPLDVAMLTHVASEHGNERNHLGVARVDVTVPRRLLAAGLHLVDMPGVGGLDSAIGALNLARLDEVDGVVLVTDCTQELTKPELTFAMAARARCPAMVCVMTKADMQHRTEAIAGRNRAHLESSGLGDVPLRVVSSVLHLIALAQGDHPLESESGFAELLDALHVHIWEPSRRRAVAAAGRRLADLTEHVAIPIEAEQRALESPVEAERIITRMAEMEDRVRQLRSSSAGWQQRLADGVADVANELDDELRERLRSIARLAEAHAETETGDGLAYEAWLHKTTMETILGHYHRIGERLSALSDQIAGPFLAIDHDASLQVRGEAPTNRLVAAPTIERVPVTKDRAVRRVVTTSQGYSSGMVLTSSLFGLFAGPFVLIPVITLPVAGMMARRAFVDDRDRRRDARRDERKQASSRYLDDVGSVVFKDSHETIRRGQRQIHQHYAERAERLERTLSQARAAAEQPRRQNLPGVAPREAPSLADDVEAVRQLRSAAERLVADQRVSVQGAP